MALSPLREDECSICYEDRGALIQTNCSHAFHSTCLEDWFRTNSEGLCPMCRCPVQWFGRESTRTTVLRLPAERRAQADVPADRASLDRLTWVFMFAIVWLLWTAVSKAVGGAPPYTHGCAVHGEWCTCTGSPTWLEHLCDGMSLPDASVPVAAPHAHAP